MRVRIIIKWEEIVDPQLREAFRRLVNVVGNGEYIVAECERPELLGKFWALPPWIRVIPER